MITIPKKVEYSIELIGFLSKNPDKLQSLNTVAEATGLPYRFMGQLAKLLKDGLIIESREGKTGGYLLLEGWKDKTLFDLITILGEDKHMVRCLGNGQICGKQHNCRMRPVWSKIENKLIDELKSIKLGEI